MIGVMLGALLYAWLRWRRAPGMSRGMLEGTLAPVLAAEAEISFELEPIVEWEWVPAPWRNGRLLPRRHEWWFGRRRGLGSACHGAARWVGGGVRGPPWGRFRLGMG